MPGNSGDFADEETRLGLFLQTLVFAAQISRIMFKLNDIIQ